MPGIMKVISLPADHRGCESYGRREFKITSGKSDGTTLHGFCGGCGKEMTVVIRQIVTCD